MMIFEPELAEWPVTILLEKYLPNFCWQDCHEITEAFARVKPGVRMDTVRVALREMKKRGLVEILKGIDNEYRKQGRKLYRRAYG